MTDSQRSYYEMIIERGGGLITCGNSLGVMVAPAEAAVNCPAGWGFVPLEGKDVTLERIAAMVEHVSRGRADWPKNPQRPGKRTEEELLEEVFSSQDYIGS